MCIQLTHSTRHIAESTSSSAIAVQPVHHCTTHLPVQYAAPLEKKMDTSDPISPDHLSSCSLLAGRPVSSLAAQSVVAALALPPPSPAPDQQADCVKLAFDDAGHDDMDAACCSRYMSWHNLAVDEHLTDEPLRFQNTTTSSHVYKVYSYMSQTCMLQDFLMQSCAVAGMPEVSIRNA